MSHDEDPRADDGVRVYGYMDLWKLERVFFLYK